MFQTILIYKCNLYLINKYTTELHNNSAIMAYTSKYLINLLVNNYKTQKTYIRLVFFHLITASYLLNSMFVFCLPMHATKKEMKVAMHNCQPKAKV